MDLVNDLTCPVCLELYSQPVILPCSHVLCRQPCAEHICESNFIRCPICRENCYLPGGLTSLTRVISIENIIDKMTAGSRSRAASDLDPNPTDFHCNDRTANDIARCGVLSSPLSTNSLRRSSTSQDVQDSQRISLGILDRLIPPIAGYSLSHVMSGRDFNDVGQSAWSADDEVQRILSTRGLADDELQNVLSTRGQENDQLPNILSTRVSSENQLQNILSTRVSPENQLQNISSTRGLADDRLQNILSTRISPENQLQNILAASSLADDQLQNILSTRISPENQLQHILSTASLADDRLQNILSTRGLADGKLQNALSTRRLSDDQSHQQNHEGGVRQGGPTHHDTKISRQVAKVSEAMAQVLTQTTHTFQTAAVLDEADDRLSMTSQNGGVSLSEDTDIAKKLEEKHQTLCEIRCQLLANQVDYVGHVMKLQDVTDSSRHVINQSCDALIQEVETKRKWLLERVSAARRRKEVELGDNHVTRQALLTFTRQLLTLADSLLKAGYHISPEEAETVFASMALAESECRRHVKESTSNLGQCYIVDFRTSMALIRDLDFLSAPNKPVIDVEKCFRNSDKVLLSVRNTCFRDVIDHYEIFYCTMEQHMKGAENMLTANVERDVLPAMDGQTFRCVLIENLTPATVYLFCVVAVNQMGRSLRSDHAQCVTLNSGGCHITAPVIEENLCYRKETTAHVFTSVSPKHTNHVILYKSTSSSLWTGIRSARPSDQHVITHLRADTSYVVAMISTSTTGEFQISQLLLKALDHVSCLHP